MREAGVINNNSGILNSLLKNLLGQIGQLMVYWSPPVKTAREPHTSILQNGQIATLRWKFFTKFAVFWAFTTGAMHNVFNDCENGSGNNTNNMSLADTSVHCLLIFFSIYKKLKGNMFGCGSCLFFAV